MTPIEAQNFIQARIEGEFETAWRFAALQRMKRLPDDPSELYRKRSEIQSATEMRNTLRAVFERSKQATSTQRRK